MKRSGSLLQFQIFDIKRHHLRKRFNHVKQWRWNLQMKSIYKIGKMVFQKGGPGGLTYLLQGMIILVINCRDYSNWTYNASNGHISFAEQIRQVRGRGCEWAMWLRTKPLSVYREHESEIFCSSPSPLIAQNTLNFLRILLTATTPSAGVFCTLLQNVHFRKWWIESSRVCPVVSFRL